MTDRVRVDRGDGKLFNVAKGKDLDAFKALNPGARVIGDRGPLSETTPQEEAATAALSARPGGFASMTVAGLKAYAEEHEVDLSGASVKADIIARLEASSGEAAEDEGN